MKKILLIGSTGYLGKKLKLKLSKNNILVCPSRKKGFDIRKKSELKKYLNNKIDIVINLSGQQSENQRNMTDVIRMGNKNIIELSSRIKKNIKLIYISTSLVYGTSNKIFKENSKIKPINKYEKNKYDIEKLYMKCENDYIILRICNLYGRDKNKGAISQIIKSILKKKTFYFDNINTTKNFIFIGDVVCIINKLIYKNIKNKVFNVGNENIKFTSLVNFLKRITNNSFRYQNKGVEINQTLSQKIDNNLVKNIMHKYKFKKLKNYLINEIRN